MKEVGAIVKSYGGYRIVRIEPRETESFYYGKTTLYFPRLRYRVVNKSGRYFPDEHVTQDDAMRFVRSRIARRAYARLSRM